MSIFFPNLLKRLLVVTAVVMVSVAPTLGANDKAILIEMSRCSGTDPDNVPRIQKGINKVRQAFQSCDGYTVKRIADLDSSQTVSLKEEFNERQLGVLVVYLSGYLVKDPNAPQDIRFAYSDFDPSRFEETTLSLDDLYAMMRTQGARAKILVLDTFAGPLTDQENTKTAQLFAKGSPGISLFVSSKNGCQGQFWKEQEMSLFAYWFAEGIRGSADRSLDGNITFEELSGYIKGHIEYLANALGTPQVSYFRIDKEVVMVVPKPETQKDSIDRIANQMKAVIPHYGMNRIAVSEFTLVHEKQMKSASKTFINFPKLLAKDLETRLITKSTLYTVFPSERLQENMSLANIDPENILSEKSKTFLEGTEIDGKPLSAIIVGFFKKPTSLNYTCGLVDIATMKPLLIASAIVDQDSHLQQEIQSNGVLSPNYPVQIQVKNEQTGIYENRPIQILNDRAYVPLRQGEVYQIVLGNLTEEVVGFRVLVDGLNTHPERDTTPVAGQELPKTTTTHKSRQGNLVAQKMVPLREANFWVLKPTSSFPEGGAKIQGFYSQIGEQSTYREFLVTKASQSKAAQAGEINEMGIITVGIYSLSLRPKNRGSLDLGIDSTGLGTAEGTTRVGGQINVFKGMETGEMKAPLLYIRYVTPENLKVLSSQMEGNDNI